MVAGIVMSNTRPFQVGTSAGVLELDCEHAHSTGEKVNLLVSRRGVLQAAQGKVSGVVMDAIFRQDGFKVILENGLDFYLPDAPRMGEKIYLTIPAEGVKCLS